MIEDKDKHVVGVKHDKEKLRYDLLPIKPIEAIVRVLGYGGNKYSSDNWKRVPDCQRRYYSACMRHITAWWDGEKRDKETGESHLAHAATCLIFMMWHEMKEKETPPLEAKHGTDALQEVVYNREFKLPVCLQPEYFPLLYDEMNKKGYDSHEPNYTKSSSLENKTLTEVEKFKDLKFLALGKITRIVPGMLVYVRAGRVTHALKPSQFLINDDLVFKQRYGGQAFKELGIFNGMNVVLFQNHAPNELGVVGELFVEINVPPKRHWVERLLRKIFNVRY